jgi:hypothetical protein
MSIDIQTENLCSIAEAAKRFPGRPHVATIWRYVHHGVHGQRLETIKVGANAPRPTKRSSVSSNAEPQPPTAERSPSARPSSGRGTSPGPRPSWRLPESDPSAASVTDRERGADLYPRVSHSQQAALTLARQAKAG